MNTTPRIVSPPVEELPRLRQPLTPGESLVLQYFLQHLPPEWEIYIQPHLNGLMPDFVLLCPGHGIAVFEVKDWDLDALHYSVAYRPQTGQPILMASNGNKTFCVEAKNPVPKIALYKDELQSLYCPRIAGRSDFSLITAGILFPFAETARIRELLAPIRDYYKHSHYPKLFPIVGHDVLESTNNWSIDEVFSHRKDRNPNFSMELASDLRHWLVEPDVVKTGRVPLISMMKAKAREIALNRDNVAYRRVKGAAGTGKSFALAGRAATLAAEGKKVLIVTFNITLINFLIDLAVQFAQDGKVRRQITAINFHRWCKRIAVITGHNAEYRAAWSHHSQSDVLQSVLAAKAAEWVNDLDSSDQWDAILVDEGQDFEASWWSALRKALREGGEMLLCADFAQNIYGVTPWTDREMTGAGFRGPWLKLDAESYRLPPQLCALAQTFIDYFIADTEPELRPQPAQHDLFQTERLRWVQLPPKFTTEMVETTARTCVEEIKNLIRDSDQFLAFTDLVCLVEDVAVGAQIVGALRRSGISVIDTLDADWGNARKKKMAFFRGDARVKVTTLQSFKGWETCALVVQLGYADSPSALALAYAGMTRLKQRPEGSYLTVICSAPQLRKFGRLWPDFAEYTTDCQEEPRLDRGLCVA